MHTSPPIVGVIGFNGDLSCLIRSVSLTDIVIVTDDPIAQVGCLRGRQSHTGGPTETDG